MAQKGEINANTKRRELHLMLFQAEQETRDNGKRCALSQKIAREQCLGGTIGLHLTNLHRIHCRRSGMTMRGGRGVRRRSYVEGMAKDYRRHLQ